MKNISQKKKNLLRNRKGFTLIELVVVIVIIGILAAIVIPRLTGFTDTAEKGADLAAATTIAHAAAAAYASDTGTKDTTAYDAISELIGLNLLPSGTSATSQSGGTWVISFNAGGDVKVTDGTVVYDQATGTAE